MGSQTFRRSIPVPRSSWQRLSSGGQPAVSVTGRRVRRWHGHCNWCGHLCGLLRVVLTAASGGNETVTSRGDAVAFFPGDIGVTFNFTVDRSIHLPVDRKFASAENWNTSARVRSAALQRHNHGCWCRSIVLESGTVTLLRQVMGYAVNGIGLLAVLAWVSVIPKLIVLSTGELLAAAFASMVIASSAGADAAGRLKAAARLRKQGRITDATIVSVNERYNPHEFVGWVTAVKVSFADASGHLINAGYTDFARAGGKKEGQAVQITYDPERPISIAPVGGDPRVLRRFSWRWVQPPAWEWQSTSHSAHSADLAPAARSA